MQKNIFKEKEIKNIIFDYGGVILNIDYQLTVDAFMECGLDNFNELYSKASQNHLFDKLETGKISPASFRQGIRDISGLTISDEQIDYAWNKIILDMPRHRIDFLLKLKKKYRIFLLSNTNKIHYDFYLKQLQDMGFSGFDAIFEKAWFSHEIGLRKPDPAVYSYVLEEKLLLPKSTLFIDDSLQNISIANEMGIQCHWLQQGAEFEMLFDDELNFLKK
ncbi:MAG: HAD family phosphatase [Bacteroidetes bacterium]|nr:HAD family phosphatase [Bacteroidota bacterium]